MNSPKVFISYSREDSDWARTFAEALRQHGVEVWFEQWSIAPGDSVVKAVETGIRESDVIVAILSRSNANNPNIYFELGVALGAGKLLIPIVAEDLETSMFPFDLRTRRYLIKGTPAEIAQEVALAAKAGGESGKEDGD